MKTTLQMVRINQNMQLVGSRALCCLEPSADRASYSLGPSIKLVDITNETTAGW